MELESSGENIPNCCVKSCFPSWSDPKVPSHLFLTAALDFLSPWPGFGCSELTKAAAASQQKVFANSFKNVPGPMLGANISMVNNLTHTRFACIQCPISSSECMFLEPPSFCLVRGTFVSQKFSCSLEGGLGQGLCF